MSLPVQVWPVQSRAGRTGASLAGVAATLRIPRQSGRGFRFDVGHRSDLIPATIPK